MTFTKMSHDLYPGLTVQELRHILSDLPGDARVSIAPASAGENARLVVEAV